MSGTYRDLEVWKAAMELAVQVYRLTSAVSEGREIRLDEPNAAGRCVDSKQYRGRERPPSDKELIQFLCHSRGSLFEIETQLTIGERLGYSTTEDCE